MFLWTPCALWSFWTMRNSAITHYALSFSNYCFIFSSNILVKGTSVLGPFSSGRNKLNNLLYIRIQEELQSPHLGRPATDTSEAWAAGLMKWAWATLQQREQDRGGETSQWDIQLAGDLNEGMDGCRPPLMISRGINSLRCPRQQLSARIDDVLLKHVAGWIMPTLVRVSFFTQSTHSNAHLFQKHHHRHTQK